MLPYIASAKVEIIGDKGVINVDTVDDSVVINSVSGCHYPIGFNRISAFEAELSHFMECIEENTIPRVGVTEGFEALKVAMAAHNSVKDTERLYD